MIPALFIALASYLLGSLVAGIFYSRALGQDIRDRDLPGGSGTYRQFGPQAAIIVTALDALKGALAVLLARYLAPEWTWLASLGVVLGHCYPAFFGLKGGGGVAPLLGVMLVVAWQTTLVLCALTLLCILVYKKTLQTRLKLNAIPFAMLVVVPVGLWLGGRWGGMAELLAGGLAMAIRALDLVRLAQERA